MKKAWCYDRKIHDPGVQAEKGGRYYPHQPLDIIRRKPPPAPRGHIDISAVVSEASELYGLALSRDDFWEICHQIKRGGSIPLSRDGCLETHALFWNGTRITVLYRTTGQGIIKQFMENRKGKSS